MSAWTLQSTVRREASRSLKILVRTTLWFEHIAIVVSNMNEAYGRVKAAHAALCLERSSNPAGVEQRSGGHIRILFSRPGWTLPGIDPFSSGQGSAEVAASVNQDIPGYRSYCDRGLRYPAQHCLLPRHSALQGGWEQRKLRGGTRAPQRCVQRPCSHHQPSCGIRNRDRASRLRNSEFRSSRSPPISTFPMSHAGKFRWKLNRGQHLSTILRNFITRTGSNYLPVMGLIGKPHGLKIPTAIFWN